MASRKTILTLLLAVMCLWGKAQKVVFAPQYTPQSQFAGYYVAKAKNFYYDEGLDVVIRHIGVGTKETSADLLIDGQADIAGQQLFQSILLRDNGTPVVNVMQLTQRIGLCCVTRKPIKSVKDLDGMKIGKWVNGYSEICETLEKAENIDIEWVPAFNPVNLYAYGAVDGILVYSYNELIQLDQAVGGIDNENVFVFADQPSLDIPEDGLYVTEDYYLKNRETVEKFVRATKKGWDYVREHPDEALEISLKVIRDNNIVTNRSKEKNMLEQYLKLQINPATGKPDYAQISESELDKLISAMMANGAITENVEHKDFIK